MRRPPIPICVTEQKPLAVQRQSYLYHPHGLPGRWVPPASQLRDFTKLVDAQEPAGQSYVRLTASWQLLVV